MSFFDKIHQTVSNTIYKVTSEVKEETHHVSSSEAPQNRFGSFAPPRAGCNDVKWYVDGAGYFWAVSEALERARESIWILDWWLSPELYLRRPPSKNEQYRLDRMLQAAAQRGVKVNVIVYKEVTQALTLSSSHTKHTLEDLHQNICVFRHPDHLPDAQTFQSSFVSSLQNTSLSAATIAKLPGDALKAVYGANEDTVLYWAHHEKLCLIDGNLAFMGGLDMCYGRWDSNNHPIADAHPGNLDDIVFPGQDFNNARIMDFNDVVHWQNNKLDRRESSRMGWSDISISLHGPVVHDLRKHFVDRWNFIYNEKYDVRQDTRYSRLSMVQVSSAESQEPQKHDQSEYQAYNENQNQGNYPHTPPTYNRGQDGDYEGEDRGFGQSQHPHFQRFEERFEQNPHMQHLEQRLGEHRHMREMEGRLEEHFGQRFNLGDNENLGRPCGPMSCQLLRSCGKWSNGTPTEHSIQTAYISVIENAQHFIYIENQFFITATGDSQRPVGNQIGAALVARILRAARSGDKFKVIVIMPAIPAFAGDLKDDASLGTRAIMEFQYNSINRAGHSIMEEVGKAGFNPTEYIRFYNLRNYDRINNSAVMAEAEQRSGVDYELARREHDDYVDPMGQRAHDGQGYSQESPEGGNYQRYQQAASQIQGRDGLGTGRWDSVSECYMLGGEDIRNVPWENGNIPEIDSFVSEELYVHSKVLIADDRTVICGSANLNDRSQLGTHDSEIALLIQDPTPLQSTMDGQPWEATQFAATLRRQLFRKHLGLIPAQDFTRPDDNFFPITFSRSNVYDFNSPEDQLVEDPLSDRFLNFWNSRARTNTEAFSRIFHPVPDDKVQSWKEYDEFYETYFKEADEEAGGKGTKSAPRFRWGHVVRDEFSEGEQGLQEVKELLSTIKGTLVEMPLLFLIKEDIAKIGIGLNSFTEPLYT